MIMYRFPGLKDGMDLVKDLTSPIKDNGGMVNEDSSILIILQE